MHYTTVHWRKGGNSNSTAKVQLILLLSLQQSPAEKKARPRKQNYCSFFPILAFFPLGNWNKYSYYYEPQKTTRTNETHNDQRITHKQSIYSQYPIQDTHLATHPDSGLANCLTDPTAAVISLSKAHTSIFASSLGFIHQMSRGPPPPCR